MGTTFVIVGVAAIVARAMRPWPRRPSARRRIEDPKVIALFVGVVVAMVLGFIDDRWQIRARYQLAGPARCWPCIALAGRHHCSSQIANPFQFLGHAFGDPNLDLTFTSSSSTSGDASSSRCPSCSRRSGSWA